MAGKRDAFDRSLEAMPYRSLKSACLKAEGRLAKMRVKQTKGSKAPKCTLVTEC
jgi:hypothetical protein